MAIQLVKLLEVDPKLYLLLFLCFLLTCLFLTLITSKPAAWELPHSPPKLPIIGNLHQLLGELPHHTLCQLSEPYGSLMHLQLGGFSALIVSSSEMAEQVLKTHDLLFCSRPHLIAWEKFSYGGLDMVAAPYDQRLKSTRKLCMSELFNSQKVKLFKPIREEEVGILVRTIAHCSSSRLVNLSEMFLCLFNNITKRQVFGRRASRDGECMSSPLDYVLLEINNILGDFSIGDIFPNMAWLNIVTDWQGRLERCFCNIDKFLEEEIDVHVAEAGGSDSRKDSFIRTLIRLQNDPSVGILLTKDKIKAIVLDMFFGGSETTTSSLEWAMSELVMNPRVMKKAQEEI